ncbi:GNAT family N-acetyltransferase [Candidatus Roizmanbacteria bacterium]|nr:GNAT family N-acetyltransferase [Candidatus Roizmanbacteria bacterium]
MKAVIYTVLSDHLKQQWEQLWLKMQSTTIMNSPYWFVAAMDVFKPERIRLVCVYEDDQLLAIAPFFECNHYGILVYATPIHELGDRSSILCDFTHKEVVKLLVSKIAELRNVWLTGLLKHEASTLREFITTARMIKSDLNAYIDFSDGPYGEYPEYMRNKIMRRSSRSPQAFRAVHCEDFSIPTLQLIFELDQKSVKQQKGRSIFGHEDIRKFIELLYTKAPRNMHISILYAGEQLIAYSLGYVCGSVYQGSQKAYMPGFEYYSPGAYLLFSLLDYMRQKGSPELDFGKGYDRFKSFFTKKTRQLYTVEFTRNSWTSHYLLSMYKTRQRLYALVENHYGLYAFYKRLKHRFI